MAAVQIEKSLPDTDRWNEHQDAVIRTTSSQFIETKVNQKVIHKKSSSNSNQFVTQSQPTANSALNRSEAVATLHTTSNRSASMKTTKSNVHEEIIPNTTSTPLKKAIIPLKVISSIDVESVISDTSESTIPYGMSSDSDELHFPHHNMVTSPSTNFEKAILRQDRLDRLTPVMSNHYNNYQETFVEDISGDLNKFSTLHERSGTSVFCNPEKSSTQLESTVQPTLFDT
jgi:hypothetical protein